ncbi:MAG: TRAP transporter fused permease subunit [Pararhodobacter sp.]|nr:TRAP transporter fused permease subunit [Pararhodobacter sp.]
MTLLLGASLTGIALYSAGIGSISEYWHRAGVMLLAGVAVIISLPLAKGRVGMARMLAVGADLVIMAAFAAGVCWVLVLNDRLWSGLYILSPTDVLFAAMGLASLLELTRRSFGWPLAVLAAAGLVYAYAGADLPGVFRHAGYSDRAIAQTVWFSLNGVFGVAASVMVTLVFIYIVFGAILEGTGAGNMMLRVATGATGRLAGGPAHAAVGASALFGTISGSVTANVVGTGVFTMSMMKRRGFSPAFSGGVEASASSAGQFLPPVMGAAAFLMAELVGVSYLTIATAALLPALIFFAGLFIAVSVEARKLGMKPTPRTQADRLNLRDMVQSLLFVLPIVTVIGALIMGRSPAYAAFAAIICAIVIGLLLNPQLRKEPWRIATALANGGIAGAKITIAVGAIGILIGVLNLTGLGMRLSEAIISLGGGMLLPSLLVTMIASLVLGMGLPTLPAYLIIVILIGPALEQLGVPLVAAHLFVMYFSVFSAITPPVALAAFAAAPIVGADPLRISLAAIRLSLPGFLIPYVFVTQPELLMIYSDGPVDVILISVRLLLAIWLISTALSGYDSGPLSIWGKALRLLCALGLVVVWGEVQIVAAAGGVAFLISSWLGMRNQRQTPGKAGNE